MGQEGLQRFSRVDRAESRHWRWREAQRMKQSPADQKHRSKEQEAEMARQAAESGAEGGEEAGLA